MQGLNRNRRETERQNGKGGNLGQTFFNPVLIKKQNVGVYKLSKQIAFLFSNVSHQRARQKKSELNKNEVLSSNLNKVSPSNVGLDATYVKRIK